MKRNQETSRSAHSKGMRWITFVRPVAMLLVMLFLCTYVTYAWLRRDWTPTIQQDGITIATGGSLVFQLDDNSVGTVMSINDVLKLDDFVLKPVSNRHGTSDGFFTLDMSGGDGLETYKYLNVNQYTSNSDNYSRMGIDNGYIEFKVALLAPGDQNRYVFIDTSLDGDTGRSYSAIEFNSAAGEEDEKDKETAKCIRVSVTVTTTGGETENNKTYIFLSDKVENPSGRHMGVDDKKDNSGNYYMDGEYYHKVVNGVPSLDSEGNFIPEKENPELGTGEAAAIVKAPSLGTTIVGHFKDYNGYDKNGEADTSKTLCELIGGQQTWLTIRVWAEGTDPICTEDIAGNQIDLRIRFSSYADAPESDTQ